MNSKILVVDDEKGITTLLKDYFEINDYEVYTAQNGKEALEKISKNPDIILLDINMPEIDGIEVCSRIRNYISCPILFLTAKIENYDKINGFRVGADDYIVKPFDLEELGARVSAHLRREQRKSNHTKVNFYKDLVIDYEKRSISIDNNQVSLSKKEFDIVELLSTNPGQVFDRERIYDRIWGYDKNGNSDVIMEHIRKIRIKLSRYTLENYIETVWGAGYKWIK
ncbi:MULTISPECIES: response regulator transcription factor [unclassified Clostridioides]|uniref:response regulator transcription factor n=1 Tax=unclassified Clostridioides TaxID=2635829 RepID=UPI001D0C1226|nr:response regulator transcription factor [Clostridioides sp. ES-S-0001-02]MCC0656414.1 response regulator transcription factor [Clostridioides sp. ES-S-0123-01]MCC0674403.1 response regulator transcription factor [Clostridioides sp. ES-S-0145-01]MCC0764062.1 response regulator transcription factor [Clostridioides sp. ES-S-0006-03]UDN58006.1 response regulator transcription factor [Clostridioides sp. ES-S-0010-02]